MITINTLIANSINITTGPKLDEPWLCFTAEEAGSTVKMAAYGEAPKVSLEYSTDGNTWSPFVVGTTTVTLANIGDKMYMRATSEGNTGMGSSESDFNEFEMKGKIAASGNVDTLLNKNGNATLTNYCYSYLFGWCDSLTTAPELPATTLANNCYYSMFSKCSSLTTAPELPATTLAVGCYSSMFFECTSLTTAPVLPATTLASNCYNSMFYYCTSLTTAPELPATELADGCYLGMFSYCSSLTTAPVLPATTLANNCYISMFSGCTSLTTAPELPSTTLADSCYLGMFQGCESLTTAPELPATTLARSCYDSMFSMCRNLKTITLGYTGNFADDPLSAFNRWVEGITSTGTFYYNGSDTTTGESAIPEGWTIVRK